MFSRVCFLPFVAPLLLSLGCGSDKSGDGGGGVTPNDRRSGNSVSGTLMMKGQPVVAGTVAFVTADKKEYAAPINAEGRYFIEDAAPGKYVVVVRALPGAPTIPGKPKVELPDPPTTAGVQFPAKYSDPKTSGLTFEVTKGEQTYNISLP